MTATVLPDALARVRTLVDPALRQAVHTLDPDSRRLASYHLGWTGENGRPSDAPGGKAVRPTLALLSAQAAGADAAVGVPGAVAVELVHNFSLLHDDLMDGDVERRHRTTVWALYGAPAAILVGDAMLALATQVLLDTESPHGVAAARLLAGATQELIRGQFDDVGFEQRRDVSVTACIRMAAGKTGALLGCSSAIGALLAGAPAATVDALWTFGAEIGLAFQLIDDLIGIWGDPAVSGKPVGSDLRARKKTLPVTWAIANGGAAGSELRTWLATAGPDTDADISHASALVHAAGGRDWAEHEAHNRLEVAERALSTVRLESQACAELLALGRFIVTREF
jgi:geranylgeranyl diphosphate synthase type I